MAGDWLKMREDLYEDPAVLQIAAKLGTRPEHVVGYCHRFWSWVSRNVSPDERDKCPAGCVTGVPIVSVENVLNLPGFLGHLVDVGWLEYETDGETHLIRVPKFDRHLSKSAKKRAIDAEKKRNQRSSRPDHNGTNVPLATGQKRDQRREEKRREENNTYIPSTKPETFQFTFEPSDELKAALAAWLKLRSGAPHFAAMDSIQWEAIVMQRGQWSPDRWLRAFRKSTEMNSKGLIDPDEPRTNGTHYGRPEKRKKKLFEFPEVKQ
jgi:hypothetical protein